MNLLEYMWMVYIYTYEDISFKGEYNVRHCLWNIGKIKDVYLNYAYPNQVINSKCPIETSLRKEILQYHLDNSDSGR